MTGGNPWPVCISPNEIGIYRTPLSGIGETGDVCARRRQDQRAPPAGFEDAPLVPKIEQHLEIWFSALRELIDRRDRRGDDFAVAERFDYLDALLGIACAGCTYPGADPLLAQAVEGDRGHEYGMLEKFARRGLLPGKTRIDHQRVGFAARSVIVQYVFFGDLERALGEAALSNGGFVPGLVLLPAGHEIPREMPLLLRFDISIQSVRNGHATFPWCILLNVR